MLLDHLWVARVAGGVHRQHVLRELLLRILLLLLLQQLLALHVLPVLLLCRFVVHLLQVVGGLRSVLRRTMARSVTVQLGLLRLPLLQLHLLLELVLLMLQERGEI